MQCSPNKVVLGHLHGVPGLISITNVWHLKRERHTHTHFAGHFRGFDQIAVLEKYFVLRLETILKFALMQSTVIDLYHKDTISYDVCDSGMVFYIGLFLDDKLFTLHSSVWCFLFLPKVLTLILSLLCLRALEAFVLLKTFVILIYF